MDFLLDFKVSENDNSNLLHLHHAALQYMTTKNLFKIIREQCELYQHLQVGVVVAPAVQSSGFY